MATIDSHSLPPPVGSLIANDSGHPLILLAKVDKLEVVGTAESRSAPSSSSHNRDDEMNTTIRSPVGRNHRNRPRESAAYLTRAF